MDEFDLRDGKKKRKEGIYLYACVCLFEGIFFFLHEDSLSSSKKKKVCNQNSNLAAIGQDDGSSSRNNENIFSSLSLFSWLT